MKKFFNVSILLLLFHLWILPGAPAAEPVDLEEQVRSISAELRCPVCQNLSVADSPSELAQEMRGVILQQLKEGKTPEQIKAYFVSKYGEWVLLAPTPKGFSLLVWILPFIALTAGILFVVFVTRRWVRQKSQGLPGEVDPALIQRVQRDVAREKVWEVGSDAEGPRALLLHEQAGLYTELQELEFDHEAGKLSEADYRDLRQRYETQAATVLKELDSSAPRAMVEGTPHKEKRQEKDTQSADTGRAVSRRGWVFAATGALLLLFGVTLGVLLGKSLRPRGSSEESITGDFLTGTGPAGISRMRGNDLQSLLSQGRAAFDRQDWPQAIDAFKKALAVDSTQPEAHSYMGLILAGAGHSDDALLAFDRALSNDPDFPLALWGKGMLLYRHKGDLSGAQQNLEKLVSLLPPGVERNAVQRTIDEMRNPQAAPEKAEALNVASNRIRGTISVDPKLKGKANGQEVLFIIVRSANSQGGPPLAVKKIDRPVFPLSYSLGPENTMIPNTPFRGKVNVSARLDKDRNPITREPGSLVGEYKENPTEIGSQTVDIVIDKVL